MRNRSYQPFGGFGEAPSPSSVTPPYNAVRGTSTINHDVDIDLSFARGREGSGGTCCVI